MVIEKKITRRILSVAGCVLPRFVAAIGFATCLVVILISSDISAQAPLPTQSSTGEIDQTGPDPTPTPSPEPPDPATPKKPKRGTLILAPIPITSPAFGSGLILGAGYVFKLNLNDKTSPASTIGLAAVYTSSGSRGAGLGGRFYFSENKYQAAFAFGKGRANYDFYGVGRIPGRDALSVEIHQSGSVFFAEFLRNIGKNVFIGPRYQYRKLTATFGGETTANGFEIPQIDLLSTTSAIGVHVQRDTRDSQFYPRKGSLLDFKADFFAKAIGSNRNYQTYSASYNGYHSIGPKQVVAYRGFACSVSERTPFFDLCLYGTHSDLRGYTGGEFQNRRMFAGQIEFRQELPYRMGIVGFAGIGGVARDWNQFRSDKLLPAAGVGFRFKLDKANHINYRIDLGFGRTGYTLSLSVTEAF